MLDYYNALVVLPFVADGYRQFLHFDTGRYTTCHFYWVSIFSVLPFDDNLHDQFDLLLANWYCQFVNFLPNITFNLPALIDW